MFAHTSEAGIRHYFVEQDDPEQLFESIKSSYAYLGKTAFLTRATDRKRLTRPT